MSDNKKIAIILAAHGEAETSRFIENYRVSRRTLEHAAAVMGVPPVLQVGISLFSALKKKFNPERKGSPHNRIAREQACELQNYLGKHPGNGRIVFDVHAAFSASDPSFEEAIEATKHHDGQILLSMSPVDNDLTCGQLCRYLARTRRPDDLSKVKVISRFWCDASFHRLCAAHVVAASADTQLDRSERHALLLLFHGTLVTNSSGEPPAFHTGLDETVTFAARLTELLGSDIRHPYGRIMTAYLNHDVGGEWTRPSFEETAALLADSGVSNVALFAAGYFADGNETVYREQELRRLLPACTITTIPCLNASPAFSGYLYGRVAGAVSQITRTPFP